MIYWNNTTGPVHLFKCEYESTELAAHLRENCFVDPAILAIDAGLCPATIRSYQRRLGLRPLTGNGT